MFQELVEKHAGDNVKESPLRGAGCHVPDLGAGDGGALRAIDGKELYKVELSPEA